MTNRILKYFNCFVIIRRASCPDWNFLTKPEQKERLLNLESYQSVSGNYNLAPMSHKGHGNKKCFILKPGSCLPLYTILLHVTHWNGSMILWCIIRHQMVIIDIWNPNESKITWFVPTLFLYFFYFCNTILSIFKRWFPK